MKKPPFITPTCGHPSHREPLRIGEINYTAQQINELLSLIPGKADKKEVFPNDSYLGHFPMGAQLPDMDRFAWAFVGDLDKAHPYFYYPKSNVPQGYQSGWNDMAKEFGTYLLTPGKQDQLTAEELFKEKFRLPQLTADRAIADEQGNRITDTYVKREAVANHIKQIYNQQFLDNPPLITEGYITPEMLSEDTRTLLENTGQTITNLPDGEDLQSVHGVLKLADKQYNPNSYSGLGRRILRKNIVAGVNVLTQSMMQWPNTIYIIQYDYDLQDETITVPEGCVLQFEGGMLSNGAIIFNKTQISGCPFFNLTGYSGAIETPLCADYFYGSNESLWAITMYCALNGYPLRFENNTYTYNKPITNGNQGKPIVWSGSGRGKTIINVDIDTEEEIHFIQIQGRTENCMIENLTIKCAKNGDLINGIVSLSNPTNHLDAGLMYSTFSNLIISGFKNGFYFRSIDSENPNNQDVANQYINFYNINIRFCNEYCLKLVGQFGQNNFYGCDFELLNDDAQAYIYMQSVNESNGTGYQYLRLDGCNFVGTNKADGLLKGSGGIPGTHVVFNQCWFEAISAPFVNNVYNALIIFDGCYFLTCNPQYFIHGGNYNLRIHINDTCKAYSSSAKAVRSEDQGSHNYVIDDQINMLSSYHDYTLDTNIVGKIPYVSFLSQTASFTLNGVVLREFCFQLSNFGQNTLKIAYATIGGYKFILPFQSMIYVSKVNNNIHVSYDSPLAATDTEIKSIPSDFLKAGFSIFNTSINKKVYYNGTKWVDATGAEV